MTTLTINPSASSHDALENNLGAVTLTDEIRLTAATAWGGLFLPNVTIPAGSTINGATWFYEASATTHDGSLRTAAHSISWATRSRENFRIRDKVDEPQSQKVQP